jgi:hypothetical protein
MFAASVVPDGDFDRLSEVDRQRLVTMLNWINDPLYVKGANLLLLVSGTRSEVNRRLLALPAAHHVQIALPGEHERARFVRAFAAGATRPVGFAAGEADFAPTPPACD